MDALKSIKVEGGPSGTTRLTIPNWVLFFLMLGGIGTNALNIYLINEQLKQIEKRITIAEAQLHGHANQPAHSDSARVMNELLRRMVELEQSREDR